ncbi:MAG: uroporphyrinogen-III synthase [Flavobacteriales bacterium]
MKRIQSILVSQPEPTNKKSPFYELAEKYGLEVDFRSFIQVESVPAREFRKERIDLLQHTAVIFTSRNAVDHYFRMANEMRVTVPDSMKYFCNSEAIAYYLQKYVVYRKRKIFFGDQSFDDLLEIIKKHKKEKFLLPCSETHKRAIPEKLEAAGIDFTKAILYRTVHSDISDLADVDYDLLVFFSPSGIESLFNNFPNFQQGETLIAAFGPSTTQAVEKAGLRLDIQAPQPHAPSMTMAIEEYLKEAGVKKISEQ